MRRNGVPFVEAALVVMFCRRQLKKFQGFTDQIERTGDEEERIGTAFCQSCAKRGTGRNWNGRIAFPAYGGKFVGIGCAVAGNRSKENARRKRRKNATNGFPIFVLKDAKDECGSNSRKIL